MGGRGRERGSINFIPGRQKLKYSFLNQALSLVSSIVDLRSMPDLNILQVDLFLPVSRILDLDIPDTNCTLRGKSK